MRKLILGIAAVFCAQIAFQVFVALDDYRMRLETVQTAGPVADDPVGVAELSGNDIEEVGVRGTGPTSARSLAQWPVLRNSLSQTTAKPRAVRPRSSAVTTDEIVAVVQKPARPKPAAPLAMRDADSVSVVIKQLPRTHKRSFFSKALPIIKKPYDLLKLVGSKLR